jgi:hypothetical protein
MKTSVLKNSLLILLVLFLSSCAMNPYKEFYVDAMHGRNVITTSYIKLPPKHPQLFRGTNQAEDTQQMLESGYFLIGYSQFNSSAVSNDYALDFAKKIHAAEVIIYSNYTNTVTQLVPMITPEITTVETIREERGGRHDEHGGRSSAMSTTTITEFDTTYVPTAINRYDYAATFWAHGKTPILGIRPQNLSGNERQQLGTNKGILVIAVVTGSPAFTADIFKGDIITKINDHDVIDVKDFFHTVVPQEGKTVTLTILRSGQTITKNVPIRIRED